MATLGADRGEPGLTLIELIIAITIMGFGVAAVIGAWGANIRFSEKHRKVTDAQAVLISAADRLTSRNRTLLPCIAATPGDPVTNEAVIRTDYQNTITATQTPPYDGWIVTVGDIAFWDGTVYSDACWYAYGFKLQRIQLTATSPDGGESQTIEVVKGDE